MKWLSVNKYKPVTNHPYVFAVINYKETRVQPIGIVRYEEEEWYDMDGKILLPEYTVTHFCIPDPIEIEGK